MNPRPYRLLLAVSLAVLAAPTVLALRGSVLGHDWRASPRFDGEAYVVSDDAYVPQRLDATGVAAVVATLLGWSGTPTTEAAVHERLEETGFGYRRSDFADLVREYGFEGRWVGAEVEALDRLKVPFVAHLEDGGGRFVLVRDVRSGYVYATDPTRGNVLYPLAAFEAEWAGRAFAFPDPPAQPEPWR